MLSKFVSSLLPWGLKLGKRKIRLKKNRYHLWVEKASDSEICPRCAGLSSAVYDHRIIAVKDEPIRDCPVVLHISKRRFACKTCKKPFTEPVAGVKKGCRTTERLRRYVVTACERFADLKSVRKVTRCSASYLYKNFYKRLEHLRHKQARPWPKTIGIDEHFFKRNPQFGNREFVTVFVDFKSRRLMEVVEGRQGALLRNSLAYIPGRERVKNIVIDLADSYKSFASDYFPNAKITADKFHVLRMLTPALNRHRKAILCDKNGLRLRRVLLTNGTNLEPWIRTALHEWLEQHPVLKEIYLYKESLHRLYRTKGINKARNALIAMTDAMASSLVPEVLTLRKTLLKWKEQVLAYFETKLTNGPTEGFNNKAKLIKRRAYGYRSFKNYRLRLLAACS